MKTPTHIVEVRRIDRPAQSASAFVYRHKQYWVQAMPSGMKGARYDAISGLHVPVGTAPATGEYLALHTLTELPDDWQIGQALPADFMAKRA